MIVAEVDGWAGLAVVLRRIPQVWPNGCGEPSAAQLTAADREEDAVAAMRLAKVDIKEAEAKMRAENDAKVAADFKVVVEPVKQNLRSKLNATPTSSPAHHVLEFLLRAVELVCFALASLHFSFLF